MAITSKVYGHFPEKISNKEIDFDTDTIKIMLCSDSYLVSQDNDEYKSDVTNEVSGTGYTAGGETLTGKSIEYASGDSKVVTLYASAIEWRNITATFRYAVIYCDTGTDSTSALISYIDFGSDIELEGIKLIITLDSNRVVTFTIE